MSWAGYVARIGEKSYAYIIFKRKPEGKRPLGRPRSRWDYNIAVDIRKIAWE
jgi:hypothetical protein